MSLTSNKPLLYGVAGGLVAIVLGSYFFVASKGVDEFEDFLYDKDLSDAIRYRDVDYSPLSDTITMEDVDLEVVVFKMGQHEQKLTGHLDSLVLEGARDENKMRVSFSGYELTTDPSESERRENVLYELLSQPLMVLRKMGVEGTRLEGSIAYDYDEDEQGLGIGVALDAEHVAGYEMELVLDRARKLVSSDLEEVIMASVMNPEKQLQEYGKVELVSVKADIEDHGFIERMMYLNAVQGFNYANALNNGTTFDAVEAAMESEDVKREMADILDEDSIEALSEFMAKGGSLSVSVDSDRPVKLATLIKNDKLHRDLKVEIDR